MNTYHAHTARMGPVLNGSSLLECFERSNAIEICNGTFDFYPGLPHIWKMAVGLAHTRPNESILIWSSFAVQYYVCGITKWKDDLVCLALALCSRCIDKTVLLLNMKTMWQSLNTVSLCSSGWGSYCCLAKECRCVEHLIPYSGKLSKE